MEIHEYENLYENLVNSDEAEGSLIWADKSEIERFKIDNLGKAEWAMKKIKILNQKIKDINDFADLETEKIDNWAVKETGKYHEQKEFFEGLLKEFYSENKAQDKDFKLNLPSGKVTMRKSKKFNYIDENAILDFCNINHFENAVKVEMKLNKAELKKLFPNGYNPETGEVIPGLEITEVENINVKALEE